MNERIRGFLRLEHLFKAVADQATGTSEWDTRSALSNLTEVIEILIRTDVKSDLIKELERHAATLSRLETNPNVDGNRLTDLLLRLNTLMTGLRDQRNLGQALRNDELVTAVRQRIAIPGGTCNFDLPGFHHWLQRPVEDRQRRLQRWREDLHLLEDGIAVVIKAIRESAYPAQVQAKAGYYQQALDPNSGCQLVRVILPITAAYYPEISGGRQRFSVRFIEPNPQTGRPGATSRNIDFELHCCML